jgi:hypothetical protein
MLRRIVRSALKPTNLLTPFGQIHMTRKETREGLFGGREAPAEVLREG